MYLVVHVRRHVRSDFLVPVIQMLRPCTVKITQCPWLPSESRGYVPVPPKSEFCPITCLVLYGIAFILVHHALNAAAPLAPLSHHNQLKMTKSLCSTLIEQAIARDVTCPVCTHVERTYNPSPAKDLRPYVSKLWHSPTNHLRTISGGSAKDQRRCTYGAHIITRLECWDWRPANRCRASNHHLMMFARYE